MGELNPLTGLPKVNPNQVNPLTGLPMSPSRRPGYLSPFSYGTYGSPTDYESFESRGIQVRPGSDIEELRALRQSTMDQWANGLGKAGVTFGTSIVDNTAGFLYGLGEYAAGGFDDFADSMTENPISQFTRSVKESTAEALPNYYTREQQQTTDLLSANFWADKFLGGVAYTAGAMGTAWLTGGAGLISSGARLGVNAAAAGLKATKAAAAYTAGKTIASNIAKRAGKVGEAAQIAGQRLPKGLSMLESGTAMSMAEASIEAAEVRDMKVRQGKERYMEENGLTDESQIPLNVLQTIEIQAQQAEGAAFYGNLAVLIPTNLISFGKMLRPMNPHKLNLNSRVISGTDDAGRFVAKDAYAEMGKFGRTAARTRDFVAPYVKGAATESFQEGAQSAIQRGLEEFESDRYYDSGSAELFEVLMKGGSMRTLKESLGDIGDAALSSFQDKDARESMLIGAMIGLITQGKAGFTAMKDSDQRTKESLDLLNNPNFYNLKERAGTTNAAIRYSNLMEQAQERGDMKAYYDYQMLLFQEEALHHVKNGTFDVFVKKLEDASKMTQEELEETGMASGAASSSALNPAAELVNRTKGFIKTVEKVNNMFPGTQMPIGAQALFMSKARKEELAQQIKDENIYKSALIRTAAMKDGLDSRISQALTELKDLAPNLDTTKISESRTKQFAKVMGEGKNETLVAPDKNEEIDEEIKKTFQTIENPIDQALFTEKANYLISMLNDRDYVLSAQDNLLRSPEERDLYIQRAKIREEIELQKARDMVVDTAISETLTADELKDRYSTFENISGEAQTKYDSANITRTAEEGRIIKKFNQMKKSEIEALTTENATPLELKLREKYLASRTQEEPVAPKSPEAPAPKSPEATSAPETEEVTPDSEDSLESLMERQKDVLQEQEQNKPKAPAPASTVRDNSNEIVTRTTQNVPEGAASKGQFLLDANGKVIVNANGDPLYSDFNEKRTVNGVPILDQSYLASIDVTVGKEVTLEVIEDDWWLSNKVNFQDSQLENIPIYVKVDDKYVGVLNTGRSSLRATVYREYTKGNNGSVQSRITEKYANNIFNAVDVNGDTVLYNPVESIEEDFYLAYLDENSKWVLGNVEGVRKETLETINAQINSAVSVGVNTKLTPGQVAFVLKDPNNQWRTVIGSTAKLSPEDIQVALGHLKKNDSVKFTTLVGTNILPGPGGIRLYYGDKTDNNILIDLIDENGNRLLGDLLGDNLISIDMGTVKSILNGKFKGVESIPQTLKNSLVAEYGVVEVTAKGTEVYGVITKENNLSPEQVEFIYTNLESLLTNLLTQKRYNISGAFINNSKPFTGGATYLEWLTNPRSEDGSYNGRLRTDVKSVNGTVFFDMGLRISDKTSMGQVPTPKVTVEAPVVVEEVAAPVATPAPVVEEAPAELEGDGPKVVKSRKASKAGKPEKETLVKPAEEKAARDKKYMDDLDRNYAAAQKMEIELNDFIETMTSPFPTDIVDLWIKEQQDKNCK